MSSKNIFDLISLKDKISIVTGGAGHLGSAISESLAELGSDIIVVGKDNEKGEKFVEQANAKKTYFFDYDVDLNKSPELNAITHILAKASLEGKNVIKH